MPLTDLIEVKKILAIDLDDHSLDYALNYYIQVVIDMIGEFLDMPNFYKRSRTEYYNGTGTNFLLLKYRPVFIDPEPQVWVDRSGLWGESDDSFQSSDELTFGDDFGIALDTTPAGTMDRGRSGLLIRKNDYWPRPTVRAQGFLSPFVGHSFGNVKVIYTGGYTLQDMPARVRMACIEVVGRMRYMFPLSVPLSSESYEERHITLDIRERNFLFGQAKHLLSSLRNWKF